MRVVFAGRVPLEGYQTKALVLSDFDPPMAEAFLGRLLDGVPGVTHQFITSAASQVGRTPLSLKLAAELVRREGAGGLDQATWRRLLSRLGPEEVQGVLYRRILDHLSDPELRNIASPGLVVRRLTPDIIEKVLAGPCELDPIDPARAQRLFDLMGSEASLVSEISPGVLVHRADVRRTMLPLLQRDDPEKVHAIHLAAIAYYHDRLGTEARTEELYHRLALPEPASDLRLHWDDEAAGVVETAKEELPLSSQAFLDDSRGLPVSVEQLGSLDDVGWDRQAAKIAGELRATGRFSEALAVLRQRPAAAARGSTPPLEALVLADLGRFDEALSVADLARQWASSHAAWTTFQQASAAGVRVFEARGQYEEALQWTRDVRRHARERDDTLGVLGAGAEELRLLRQMGTGGLSDANALRADLLASVDSLDASNRARNPLLVRNLAAELGPTRPDLIADAVRLGGVDLQIDHGFGSILGSILSRADLDEFVDFVAHHSQVATGGDIEEDDTLAWLARQSAVEQGTHVADFLLDWPRSVDRWLTGLTLVLRSVVDEEAPAPAPPAAPAAQTAPAPPAAPAVVAAPAGAAGAGEETMPTTGPADEDEMTEVPTMSEAQVTTPAAPRTDPRPAATPGPSSTNIPPAGPLGPGQAFALGWSMARLYRRAAPGLGDRANEQLPTVAELGTDERMTLAFAQLEALTGPVGGDVVRAAVALRQDGDDQRSKRQRRRASAASSATPPYASGSNEWIRSELVQLHCSIFVALVDQPEQISAYELGRLLRDTSWLARTGPDGTAFLGAFSRERVAILRSWLTQASSALPPRSASVAARSLQTWQDWAEINTQALTDEERWQSARPKIAAALKIQRDAWYALLVRGPAPAGNEPGVDAWIHAGESVVRMNRALTLSVLRRFWVVAAVVLVATGGLLYLAITRDTGATEIWSSLATVAGAAGVSVASLRAGTTSATKGIEREVGHAAELDALAWEATWLPTLPQGVRQRVQLSRRGVVPPRSSRLEAGLGAGKDSVSASLGVSSVAPPVPSSSR